ncbi:sulfatase-like hydrolase/transferase [Candidimonas humi]|uniref:Sulfatase-like hydrolase/transferase n=1 Tax=Candidimonas humi TaxID=683355 RepID=A0ABV8P608_9BURK
MQQQKNMVIVMSDEHDPRMMGCAGHPFVRTPALDALAAGGARFSNAYTPSPICVPARAAFATGCRVHRIGYWDNAMAYDGAQRGWGHALQERGIRVESIGKLHYRAEEDPAGFDAEHIPMHVVGGHGMVWASIRDPYISRRDGPRMLGERIGPGESPYTDYDRSVTGMACDWLRQAAQDGEPFVLYVGLVAPHFPLIAPPQFYAPYDAMELPEPKLLPRDGYVRHPWVQEYVDFMDSESRFRSPEERRMAFAAYYGLCSWLDHNVGCIADAVRQSGLDDNTYIVYTSDHGENLGARGVWGKSTLYQESVCVPMILSGPGIAPAVCDAPVDLLDLYPTILQAAGVATPALMEGRPGRSLFETLADPDPQRPVFSEYHAAGSNSAGYMLRKGRWKYHYYVRHRPELFDLQADPEELRDLAGDPAYAAVQAEMHAALLEIVDPEATDRQAKRDQRAMIERLGGPQRAATLGAPGATPAPHTQGAAGA